jgi:hypothetical protein
MFWPAKQFAGNLGQNAIILNPRMGAANTPISLADSSSFALCLKR